MPSGRTKLPKILVALAGFHGKPPPPPSRDPYELALRESCAYLADDDRRREVFERLREEIGLPALRAAIRDDPGRAHRLLRRFPGIGEPGADRILLIAGSPGRLGVDWNGLRVLLRLGYGEESRSYARSHRSAPPRSRRPLGGCRE